jgi:ribosomal protein S1
MYDQFKGLVVQKREGNILIVGLKNGWVGKIPNISIERGKRLIENYKIPEIGDEIDVSIQKIKYLTNEEAYLISLDPIEIADASWLEIQNRIPLNSEVQGKITVDLRSKYGVQLTDGNRGIIDKSTLLWHLQSIESVQKDPIDMELIFKVVGFSSTRKNILLSIPNLTKAQENIIASSVEVGQTYLGKCIQCINSYSVIQLENGHTGMLHRSNCWGTPLPNIGDTVQVSVIFISMDENEISFSTINSDPNNFHCMPVTQQLWSTFVDKYIVGDVLDVQVRDWIYESQAYVVATQSGMRGVISKKEIAWTASIDDTLSEIAIGDVFAAKIIKINDKKMKVSFSKRMVEPHPLDDPEILKIKGRIYSGQVTTVVDYGYFIAIPLLKLDGLLHKTRVPKGVTLEKNAKVNVCIVEVDLERKRVALSLPSSETNI